MSGENSSDRLNNIAQRDGQSPLHNPRYSKFILWAQRILPVIAIIILTIVLSWSSLTKDIIVPIEEGELTIEAIGQNELINPRFESRNEDGKPYIITAARALQGQDDENLIMLEKPFGEITLGPENIIGISAQQGAYAQDTQRLILKTQTKIAHSDGTTLDTEELHVQLKEGTAWSDTDVYVEHQDGNIKAIGLRANQSEETLKFLGPAKMTLTSADLGGLFSGAKNDEGAQP